MGLLTVQLEKADSCQILLQGHGQSHWDWADSQCWQYLRVVLDPHFVVSGAVHHASGAHVVSNVVQVYLHTCSMHHLVFPLGLFFRSIQLVSTLELVDLSHAS